jgi:amidophosphoribosyltransferase
MLGRRGALTVDIPPQNSDPIDGLKPNDHCAVVGFIGKTTAYPYLVASLRTLQHRGQESAGIATFHDGVISVKKGMGLVHEVFTDRDMETGSILNGQVGIGHTRYSTSGSKGLENIGPFLVSNSYGYIAISHNGEVTNANQLREQLKLKGVPFLSSSDTEVMLMEISTEINSHGIINGFRNSVNRLKGAYSCAIMVGDRLFALRDPMGFRPLVIGYADESYIVASESCVMDILNGEKIRDVKPGELVELTPDGPKSIFVMPAKHTAHCMFEYVYFARPDSVIDNVEVFQTRISLGRTLAKEYPAQADVVIPVPDSGRAQALGYSLESGIKYSEGLIKNRLSERTFIMPNQKSRLSALKLKLNPIKSEIDGKRVVLVDDSIVRGNTMKHIIAILRKAGAREVHVRVGSPRIIAPCYFGVDMKTKDQFIATGKTIEEIGDEIGADSIGYTSIDGLVKSINMEKRSLCISCLTGEYPIPVEGGKYSGQQDLESF